MPRVKPELIYEPLAPLIAAEREAGFTDDEIYAGIKQRIEQAHKLGYTGGEIAQAIQTTEIKSENRAKSFARGLAEDMSLGFYVPEFLKQKPSEIEQGVPVPGGLGEISPSGAGGLIGSMVPFMGALKAARPIVGPLATKALGAGRAGRVAGEAGATGVAGGVTGVARADQSLEERATSGAIGVGAGAVLGGAGKAAAEIMAARRAAAGLKPQPSRIIEPEIVEPQPLALPPAPAQKALTGAVVGQRKAMPAMRLGEKRVFEGPASTLDDATLTAKVEKAPAEALRRAGEADPGPYQLVVEMPNRQRHVFERASAEEAERLQGNIRESVGPRAGELKFKLGKLGEAEPPSPTAPPAPRARKPEEVRLPEEMPTLAQTLDAKGLKFRVDRSQPDSPFTIVGPGGETKRFKRLSDAVAYSDALADDVPASLVEKAIRAEPLSRQQARKLLEMRQRPRVADQPMPVPEVDPPPVLPPTKTRPIGGGGPEPRPWLGPTLQPMQPKEQGQLIQAVNSTLKAYPELEADLAAGFMQSRPASWSPTDFLGAPVASRNPIIRTAARDAAEVEAAWQFETKRWLEYYRKNFEKLSDKDAADAARLVEGDLKPGQVSQAARDAVGAWKTAATDFAGRFGIPEWSEYVTRLTDRQALYEMWRPQIVGARKFADLPGSIQERLGSPGVFETMRKAFEKNDKWEMLPRDVRGWVNERLQRWGTGTQWDNLPQAIKDRVPKEIFDRFLEPRVGGVPYERDIRKSFQAYVPIALKKLHVDPLIERWGPIANALPKGFGPASEGSYLQKMLGQIRGAEVFTSDQWVDGIVRSLENTLGRALADPKLLSRIAARGSAWTYRGSLGVDSAMLNATQTLNTWAQGGSSGFLRGLGRYLAGDAKSRPEVGLLREFGDMFTKGEFAIERAGSGLGRKLADVDDKITRVVLSPMTLAENVNRGVAFLSGLEDAAARGLSLTDGLKVGLSSASKVVPNLELSRGVMNAIHQVGLTQFGMTAPFRSPYLAGPLARLSTMYLSYPLRQSQFLVNGMSDSIRDAAKQPGMESASRLLRFTALTGLMAGAPYLAWQAGADLNAAFGLPNSLFRRSFAGPLGIAVHMFHAASGANRGEPLRQENIDRAWKDALNIFIPGQRYYLKGLPERIEAGQTGFRVDELGRQTYRTTPYGEFMKAIGLDEGQAYKERVLVQTIRKQNIMRIDERRAALNAALEGDFKAAEKYNEKYPEAPLTNGDLQQEMKLRQTPLVERIGPTFLRRRVLDEDETESSGGLAP